MSTQKKKAPRPEKKKKKSKKKKEEKKPTCPNKSKQAKKKPTRWRLELNSKCIFGNSFHELSSLTFLFILKRNFFCKFREKILELHYLFFFLLTQPNTFQKKIHFYFFSKIFLYTILPLNKHIASFA